MLPENLSALDKTTGVEAKPDESLLLLLQQEFEVRLAYALLGAQLLGQGHDVLLLLGVGLYLEECPEALHVVDGYLHLVQFEPPSLLLDGIDLLEGQVEEDLLEGAIVDACRRFGSLLNETERTTT
ncbi:MAG: hypothetical protein MUP52_06030 [Candidatus Aminicenantes bacterium]|nr:hypothetical protein [Candidatus Aminicenantes bacterium]